MSIPRRIRLDLNTPAELSITEAVREVEKLPADVRLTEVVILLQQAKTILSDVVDENLSKYKSEDSDYAGGINEF